MQFSVLSRLSLWGGLNNLIWYSEYENMPIMRNLLPEKLSRKVRKIQQDERSLSIQ